MCCLELSVEKSVSKQLEDIVEFNKHFSLRLKCFVQKNMPCVRYKISYSSGVLLICSRLMRLFFSIV